MWTRRDVVAGGGLLIAGCASAEQPQKQPSVQPVQPERDHQYVERFRAISDYIAGRLGVCAIDTGSGRTIGTNTNARFAMASTFKWLLAAAVLKRHEAIPTILDQTRRVFEEKDLLDYAPVTRAAHPS